MNPFGANGVKFSGCRCVAPTAMNRPSASSLITTMMLLARTLSFAPRSSSTVISITMANAGRLIDDRNAGDVGRRLRAGRGSPGRC